jgi:hypothetical protein
MRDRERPMMCDWVPPGYVDVCDLVGQQGIDNVRSDLFDGRLHAHRWDPSAPALHPIERTFWLRNDAPRWLATGELFDPPGSFPQRILVQVEEKLKPPPASDGSYLSPFMELMATAIRHFEISEDNWPKKQLLVNYFCTQKLPDGKPITHNQARNLATFCRPLAAMSGGNSKEG